MPKNYTILFLCIFLLCACSSNKQTDILFTHIDSLLEEYPDSALHLLRTLPHPQELSRKESAHYALLLARATDKAEKPLLPCDSLLNIALHYYDNDEKERAVALLYKGRLEIEMENTEEAIKNLQEGLSIVNDFPNEIETRRNILSSLGNLYFDTRYYEEAIKIYRKFYDCCETDKDKSIALNGISSYYCMINKNDSAIALQKEALRYAIISGDSSLIASSEHNLSIKYYEEYLDSALLHARNAINWIPKGKKYGNYYGNLGGLLLEKGEKLDSAKYFLIENLKDSTAGKAIALSDLYELEKKRGNYEAAFGYIEERVAMGDSLASIEASTDIQQLIHKYDTKIKVKKEQIKGKRRLRSTITISIFCFLIFALFYQHQLNKKRRAQLLYQQNLKQTQKELLSMQTLIEENQSITAFLQEEHKNLKTEQKHWIKEIQERAYTIEKLKQEKLKLRNCLFTQSSIYKRITDLSEQEALDKKSTKVLTTIELKKLKKIIFEIYEDYISDMCKKHPKLTEDDLLYLCLNEAQLSPSTIALCFGFDNTHAINQRKSRIKEKTKSVNE